MQNRINVVQGVDGDVTIKLRLSGNAKLEAGRHVLEILWHRPGGQRLNHAETFVVRPDVPLRDTYRLVDAAHRLAAQQKSKTKKATHGRRTRPTQRRRRPR